MSYVLIGLSVSPWVKRSRCFFVEKGVEFEAEPYAPVGGDPKPEFLAVSPLGKIPALKHGEFSVADSLAICFYIEKLHPEPALIPSDPKSLAHALWIASYGDALFSQSEGPLFTQRVLRPAFNQEIDEGAIAEALEKLPKFFDYLESQLAGRKFFVDDKLTIADLTVCSVLIGLSYAQEPVDAAKYPSLAAFYDHMTARDAFQQLLAEDRDLFEQIGAAV